MDVFVVDIFFQFLSGFQDAYLERDEYAERLFQFLSGFQLEVTSAECHNTNLFQFLSGFQDTSRYPHQGAGYIKLSIPFRIPEIGSITTDPQLSPVFQFLSGFQAPSLEEGLRDEFSFQFLSGFQLSRGARQDRRARETFNSFPDSR